MSPTIQNDDETDYLQERADRLRYLDQEKAHAETDEHPAIEVLPISKAMCLGSLALAGLAIILAGMVLGHLFLLPNATVWPLSCASLICAVASVGLVCFATSAE